MDYNDFQDTVTELFKSRQGANVTGIYKLIILETTVVYLCCDLIKNVIKK